MLSSHIKKHKDAKCESNEDLLKVIEELPQSNLNYAIYGGMEFVLFYKKIFRCHGDLDIFILRKDLDDWKNFFKRIALKLKKRWRFERKNNNRYIIYDENRKIIELLIYKDIKIHDAADLLDNENRKDMPENITEVEIENKKYKLYDIKMMRKVKEKLADFDLSSIDARHKSRRKFREFVKIKNLNDMKNYPDK